MAAGQVSTAVGELKTVIFLIFVSCPEVAVLGSSSLIILTVSVDVEQR